MGDEKNQKLTNALRTKEVRTVVEDIVRVACDITNDLRNRLKRDGSEADKIMAILNELEENTKAGSVSGKNQSSFQTKVHARDDDLIKLVSTIPAPIEREALVANDNALSLTENDDGKEESITIRSLNGAQDSGGGRQIFPIETRAVNSTKRGYRENEKTYKIALARKIERSSKAGDEDTPREYDYDRKRIDLSSDSDNGGLGTNEECVIIDLISEPSTPEPSDKQDRWNDAVPGNSATMIIDLSEITRKNANRFSGWKICNKSCVETVENHCRYHRDRHFRCKRKKCVAPSTEISDLESLSRLRNHRSDLSLRYSNSASAGNRFIDSRRLSDCRKLVRGDVKKNCNKCEQRGRNKRLRRKIARYDSVYRYAGGQELKRMKTRLKEELKRIEAKDMIREMEEKYSTNRADRTAGATNYDNTEKDELECEKIKLKNKLKQIEAEATLRRTKRKKRMGCERGSNEAGGCERRENAFFVNARTVHERSNGNPSTNAIVYHHYHRHPEGILNYKRNLLITIPNGA